MQCLSVVLCTHNNIMMKSPHNLDMCLIILSLMVNNVFFVSQSAVLEVQYLHGLVVIMGQSLAYCSPFFGCIPKKSDFVSHNTLIIVYVIVNGDQLYSM